MLTNDTNADKLTTANKIGLAVIVLGLLFLGAYREGWVHTGPDLYCFKETTSWGTQWRCQSIEHPFTTEESCSDVRDQTSLIAGSHWIVGECVQAGEPYISNGFYYPTQSACEVELAELRAHSLDGGFYCNPMVAENQP